ncbi:efflux transporter outer membrane subunit [Sphingosinicella soli]|uniref:efflux transporter outer membrane subunit n=1 Tax=Sphingosinicella soli TaxID=333708 RepID=UPI00311C9346
MRVKTLFPLLSGLALAACAAGPDYRAPAPAALGVPAAWSDGSAAPGGDAALAEWWRVYNDPALDAFVARAIENNLDIAQAVSRLRQARESLRQSQADFLPSVSASGGGGRTFREGAPDGNSFSAGADASWEIDLFGGTRRAVEASRADLAAAGYSLADVRAAIVAETVSNYVSARLAQERLRIARDTLKTVEDNYDIARWRVQAGLVSSLDEEQARAQRAQNRASIPSIEQSLAGALNRIAVLTGAAPGEATRALETPAPIPDAPEAITAGIPADTLRQRPDVRLAERALAAATARIGVAQSALYPSLRISGDVGTSALSLGSLGDIITGGLFASIGQLIFDGGATASRVRAQEAAAEGAFAAYKASVLRALEDVENALVALRAARERQVQFAEAFDAASNSAIIARSQYQAGLTDFQTLLSAEQSLLSARQGLADAQGDEVFAAAQLYSALGGGWQTMNTIDGWQPE